MGDVVIDKSVLQGGSKARLQSLFINHRVLMTEALFYELLTTEAAKRARCFRRLPAIENPVVLVYNVGPILRWEVEHRRPLSDVGDMIINARFQFNPGLLNENFDMGEEQTRHIENWNKEVSAAVSNFAEHCSKVTLRFPELKGYRPGKDTAHIEEIKNRICTEPGFVRQLYRGQERGWPTAEEIDERWALYRWLQIRVLAALDYFRKYGERNASLETVNIEHDYLDLEYCLLGCMVGALATADKGIATRFLALHPSGIVL